MGLTQITTGGVDDNINIDNNTLKVDGTNNRVGIGTASPGDKLAVSDGSNITELSGYSLYFKSDSTGYIQAGPQGGLSGRLVFQTNTAERMRIDSSGRRLSGLTSSSASASAVFQGFAGSSAGQAILQLQVGKNNAATANNENLGSVRFGNSDGALGALISSEADGQWASSDYPGRLTFHTTADGASSTTERMRIHSSGNVGINTSSPS